MDVKRFVRNAIRRILHRSKNSSSNLSSEMDQNLFLLFNKEYYAQENPDVVEAGVDPWTHYISCGMQENRAPSPLFSPDFYQDEVPGLAEPAIQHFLLRGGLEGHDPIPMGFDCRWYMSQHPEVARSRTNPLIHYLRKGLVLGYDPSPIFSVSWYRKQNPDVVRTGIEPLTHYVWKGFQEGRTPSASGPQWAPEVETASQVVEESRSWPPFATRSVPAVRRITLVADTIDSGAATAIIVAGLWANASGRCLRVLTRTTQVQPSTIMHILSMEGISLENSLESTRIPLRTDSDDLLPVSKQDVFLTTSWSSTQALLSSVSPDRIAYLLQEDERVFYPVGSNWLHANNTMNCPEISVLANSQGLFDHLIATGVGNVKDTGFVFTPSFLSCASPGRRLDQRGDRRIRICFYARPKSPRNLYSLGVAAIDKAIARGIITSEMEVVFLGDNVHPIRFVDGSASSVVKDNSSQGRQDFWRTIDIGISLATSSYPGNSTYEMAVNGSVIVTNRWPDKPNLAATLSRIVEADPDVDDIVKAISEAMHVLGAVESQPYEPEDVEIFRSWQDNLAGAIRWVEGRVSSV